MKTKQIQVETKIYICETCGKESESENLTIWCEKTHANELKYSLCEHEFTYESSIGYEECHIEIERNCPKCCLTDIVRVYEDDIDDETSKILFNGEFNKQ